MKDEWKNMKEEWHKWGGPKHEKLYVVREVTCCMNIKFLSMQAELQSHIDSCRRSILTWSKSSTRANHTQRWIPRGGTKSPVANWGAHDDVFRGMFPRNLRMWEASCFQRTTVGDCFSKRPLAGIYSTCFLENRGNKIYHGGGGAKHEEDSSRKLLALLIFSSTTIGKR